MSNWTESKTVDGTVVRSRELATDARHKVSGANQWVDTLHPYDLARYHFAHSRDGIRWMIYRDGGMGRLGEYQRSMRGTPEQVLDALRELDATVTAHIDHS